MTYSQYKKRKRDADQYAKRNGYTLIRKGYGFISMSAKVPLMIYENGCQILLTSKIRIVDVFKKQR